MKHHLKVGESAKVLSQSLDDYLGRIAMWCALREGGTIEIPLDDLWDIQARGSINVDQDRRVLRITTQREGMQ